jgi:DNA-directed RNA polymerase sigma subunit (sigma70/sigma32)
MEGAGDDRRPLMTMTVQEVASVLNISRQRVMMIEKTALAKVKAEFLKIDKPEIWREILETIKEKDPYQYMQEDNTSI